MICIERSIQREGRLVMINRTIKVIKDDTTKTTL